MNKQNKKNIRVAALPERSEKFFTHSRIEMKQIFGKKDLPAENKIGAPGTYPFTRGIHPTMYRSRLWTMRQYAGFGAAEETNRRFKFLLSQGQTGLSVAFDLPTQCGYDSDHLMSSGEVGKVGVAISSLEDMETLFHKIPLDKVSTSMTINATAPILLAFYIAVAKKQGAKLSALSGTLQNDILKEYMARGTYIFPPEPSLRLTTDIIEYCSQHLPQWNPISISGYHIREAGATAVQEVAFTIADGIEYVQRALRRGLDIDRFAHRLSFFFGCHNHFLEEVAKFRAARRIWAKIMKEKFKAKNPRAWMLRFHTQTDGVTLTAQQPDNNIVRTTVQALAAILGGTQSLHTNSKDEALSIPTEASALLALRTQQILACESGVIDTADPLGGSWCIESLTSAIENRAEKYLRKIDQIGGMANAVAQGYPQKQIQDSAYLYQQEVENGARIIVGINKYQEDSKKPASTPIHKVSPAIEKKQKEKIARFKSKRPSEPSRAALKKLEQDAEGTANLMPAILNAVESYATLGEISDTLRKVFGLHREKIIL